MNQTQKDKKEGKVKKHENKYVIYCSQCGKKAAHFQVERNRGGKVSSISYSGKFSRTIEKEFMRKTVGYLKRDDIWGLDYYFSRHRVVDGGIDVYCPKCHKVYCPECWDSRIRFEEGGWYDCTYGVCPKGHEKIIDD